MKEASKRQSNASSDLEAYAERMTRRFFQGCDALRRLLPAPPQSSHPADDSELAAALERYEAAVAADRGGEPPARRAA